MKDVFEEMGIDYIEFDKMGRIVVIAGKTTPSKLRGAEDERKRDVILGKKTG